MEEKYKWPKILIVVLAFIGLIDASYLTIKHFLGEVPFCAIGGCDIVLTSSFSEFLGIPVSLFGVIFYSFVLFSAFFIHKKKVVYALSLVVSLGLLTTIFLIYLQLYVIKSICMYCIISATAVVSISLVCTFVLSTRKNNLEYEHREV